MALKSFGQLQNNNFLLFDIVQGLEKAVSSLLPNAEHRNCARHIYSNWKKKGHSTATLRTMFWKAVKCTTRPEFERIMGQMTALKRRPHTTLRQWEYISFARHTFLRGLNRKQPIQYF